MIAFLRAAALLAALLQLSTAYKHSNLRTTDNLHRELRPQKKECIVQVIADTSLFHPETHEELEEFLCEIDPEDNNGEAMHTLPIKGTEAQMQKFKKLLADGDLVRSCENDRLFSLFLHLHSNIFLPHFVVDPWPFHPQHSQHCHFPWKGCLPYAWTGRQGRNSSWW